MKIIYLAAYKAHHPKYDMIYQDINGKRDISGCMLDVDLTPYDVIIATPPCNYYSRANYRRETSEYSLLTKHLLPTILNKLIEINKPFIVENVINFTLMKEFYDQVFVYEHGRHTYWTNIPFNPSTIKQKNEFDYRPIMSGKNKGRLGDYTPSSKRQGGQNVHNVIEYWLEVVKSYYEVEYAKPIPYRTATVNQ
jgi:site-specific DNA-cytosine methylase